MNFAENESPEKLRGGYYTPIDIAAFLTRWVLQARPRHILEPSCGDGAFFEAMARFGPRGLESVTAFEIHPKEAAKARRRARSLKGVRTTVRAADYLQWSLDHSPENPRFDAVIGNPPFIRYQYLDDSSQELAREIFRVHQLPFTMHTNAWVPFVIAAVSQLRPGGRVAMVVPAEILHVLHARSLRGFLLRQCSRILILDPRELWFGETLQGVVMLLAEKAEGPQVGTVAIASVEDRSFLEEDPSECFESAEPVPGSELGHKWMVAILTAGERSLLDSLSHHPKVRRFVEIAGVDVGIVTGANKFFLVPDSIVEEYGLSRWAHPMFGRSDHVRGVIFDRRSHDENKSTGLPANFLWFGDIPLSKMPAGARRYIGRGEKQNLHRRYKCRIRKPWYNVPSVYAAPVGLLKRCHDFPRLILNRAGAFTTDTAYRIRPISVSPSRLVYSFVNSLTALAAELEGRHYGGGVLELVPSEIERLLVPTTTTPPGGLMRLDRMVREGLRPEDLFAKQGEVVLGWMPKRDRMVLLRAWSKLRARRQRTSRGEPKKPVLKRDRLRASFLKAP